MPINQVNREESPSSSPLFKLRPAYNLSSIFSSFRMSSSLTLRVSLMKIRGVMPIMPLRTPTTAKVGRPALSQAVTMKGVKKLPI